jgi:hypothetical protein
VKRCEACGRIIPPNDPGVWTGDGWLHSGERCPPAPAMLDRLMGQGLGWLNRQLRWWDRA